MQVRVLDRLWRVVYNFVLSVPVHVKIAGIMMLPVLILGFSLNYWVTSGLSDWLSYLLTDVRVEAAMAAGRRSVTLVTVLSAAASILLASLLNHILTRPILELRDMANLVATGRLDARAPVYSNDEIGEVAAAINTMTDRLVQAQTDLTQTNRRLSAINRVIQAADRQNEIHDVLYLVLGTLLDVLNLKMGWVYLRDPERNQYHLASWRNVPTNLGEQLLHAPGSELCACQRALLTDGFAAPVNLCRCERLTGFASLDAPVTHLSLPIEAGEQRLGLINLSTGGDQSLSDADMELLMAMSGQISEIVANAWLRLKLAEKEQARQYLLESLVEAQEEERGRLARELHDGAGQMLTTLLVRLKTLERKTSDPALVDGLTAMLDLVSDTVEQVRELSYRLRPAALEEFGLAVALRTLVAEMLEKAGIRSSCQVEIGDLAVPAGVEVTLYRIVQEALTNVLRHAQARSVYVSVARQSTGLLLQVCDDGRGFVPGTPALNKNERHLGLISMSERAAMLGGIFRVESTPGRGTIIQVLVPIPDDAS